MRVGLYARVSNREQAEEGYSIEAQLEAMRRYCEDRGWMVAAEYIEPGISGTTDERPALQDALADCKAGSLDILLTHRLDRFYRNLGLQINTLSQLGKWGVGYLSVAEQIDYSQPQGRLFLSMLGAFNEYYSRNLGVEVRKGKRGRAKAGLSNANIPAHGYDRVEGKDVVNPEAAAAILRMYQMYSTGLYGYQAVADQLNAESLPAGRRSKAGRWTWRAVGIALSNPYYIGEVRHEGETYPGQHERIIPQDLWDVVQKVRGRRSRGALVRRTRHDYLLRGLLYCAQCGRKLWIRAFKGWAYYYDSAQEAGYDCENGHMSIATHVLDEQVSEIVQRLRLPQDWRERLVELAGHEQERGAVESKRKYLQGKMRRLRELYLEGDYTKGEYDRQKATMQAELDSLSLPKEPEVFAAAQAMRALQEAWTHATTKIRHEMLTIMFRAIQVDVAAQRVVCLEPWPQFTPLFRLDGLEEKEDGKFYPREREEAGSTD